MFDIRKRINGKFGGLILGGFSLVFLLAGFGMGSTYHWNGVAEAGNALTAPVAFASIPDANGVIHGCYGKPGTPYKGQLRVRDADQVFLHPDRLGRRRRRAGALRGGRPRGRACSRCRRGT